MDIVDVQSVAGRWNSTSGDGVYVPVYDINCDKTIDIIDIQLVAGQWNTSAPFTP